MEITEMKKNYANLSLNYLVLLVLVQLAQVLLLLLGHDDVDAGDGLAHHTDLGELGSGPTGHL